MTFDDALPILFEIVTAFGARPDAPIASEEFFTRFVAEYNNQESLRTHLQRHVASWYRCLGSRPDWIQDPEWPWAAGKPMVFVGSVDAPLGTFHDDGRFYLFWSPDVGTTECVIQVA